MKTNGSPIRGGVTVVCPEPPPLPKEVNWGQKNTTPPNPSMNKYKYSRKEIIKKLKEAINGKWFSSSGEENYKEAVKMLLEKQPKVFVFDTEKAITKEDIEKKRREFEHGCLYRHIEDTPTLNLPVIKKVNTHAELDLGSWRIKRHEDKLNEIIDAYTAIREALLQINERR